MFKEYEKLGLSAFSHQKRFKKVRESDLEYVFWLMKILKIFSNECDLDFGITHQVRFFKTVGTCKQWDIPSLKSKKT